VASKSYQVVSEQVDDRVSGGVRLAQREGLSAAFARCVAGEADVIGAYHQDRFARKMGVFEEIREEAIAKGIRLETADGRVLTGKEDFTNGDVVALVAALERRRISERFYAARRTRSRKDGRGSGVVPFGYAPADVGVQVDPTSAACVRLLFQHRDAGATYQETADALNAAGYRTPTGRAWSPGTVLGIVRHRALYESGRRLWDGVTAEQVWPALIGEPAACTAVAPHQCARGC
jgi:DNA invertase Pin-like site-specific DNA recombinase